MPSTTYESHLHDLYTSLQKAGNKTIAQGMEWYMKNQFTYFGVKAPIRKEILKKYKAGFLQEFKQGHLEPILLQLWDYDQRELQYCAIELLLAGKKYWKEDTIDLIEKLMLSKSWWDTVDHLGGKISGMYFLLFPAERKTRIENWIHHKSMWLNRAAIIHQLFYKEKTDVDLLLKAITPHIHSKEFFHRKAIGWALRHYSKTNPAKVKEIAASLPLSPLSKKEALRLIK